MAEFPPVCAYFLVSLLYPAWWSVMRVGLVVGFVWIRLAKRWRSKKRYHAFCSVAPSTILRAAAAAYIGSHGSPGSGGMLSSMPFDEAQKQKIVSALGAKIKNPCPTCGLHQRQFFPELMVFSLAVSPPPRRSVLSVPIPPLGVPHPNRTTLTVGDLMASIGSNAPAPGAVALPCILVTCMNCGFTEFYNVHVLGIAEGLGVPPGGGPLGT